MKFLFQLPRPVLIAVMACPGFACKPVEEKAGPPGGAVYVAPLPPARRNPDPSPELHQWLAASSSVRQELAELRSELASLQELHATYHFDDFLKLDPATLEPAQLFYLQHFLQKGYFRIEREVLLRLLEARQARTAATGKTAPEPGSATGGNLAYRLQASLERDESLVIDLENVVGRYRTASGEPVQVPALLKEQELADLRVSVAKLLEAEKAHLASLDQQITSFRTAR